MAMAASSSATTNLLKTLTLSDYHSHRLSLSKPHFLALKPRTSTKPLHFSFSAAAVRLPRPSVARTSDWAGPEEAAAAVSDGESEGVFEEREGEEEGESEPPEDAKIFVGNLPYDIDSEKLAMMFEKAGIVEIAEVIYNRETDTSRGFGFVTMSTVEEADKAVEMFNRYDVDGRLLTVNKASPRGERPERTPRSFGASFRAYVGNLPWDADNGRLEQIFSEHGRVVEARVVYDRETGRSRGFGFVTMASESEMEQAIAALDGQVLDGRAIRVNVAEERPRRSF